MPKHIELTHQAFAAYSSRNFESALSLLCRALNYWQPNNQRLSDGTYNALYDAVEIAENLSIHIPIWERNIYTSENIDALKKSLNELDTIDWAEFNEQVIAFKKLLEGAQVGFDFFSNNGLALVDSNPILSFALSQKEEIELLKWKDSPKVDALILAFNACFKIEMTSLEQCENEIQKALDSGDTARVESLLTFMMEQYPENKKQAFLQLADLHFQAKAYQKAAEAYMKTVVLGTPKESVRKNIQVACNTLAAETENSKEAARWREVLINFF
jgi:tetratricopeptide (TPR) repeat protein